MGGGPGGCCPCGGAVGELRVHEMLGEEGGA